MTLFETRKLAHGVWGVVRWFLLALEFTVIEEAAEATFPFVDEAKKYKFGAESRNYHTKQIGGSPVPLYGILECFPFARTGRPVCKLNALC